MINKEDQFYMALALKHALKGKGKVSPNPLVGAVIVKNGKIIGEGYHKKFGDHHAEINALLSAQEDTEGATIYCNLEPCSHSNKKTPPCVPEIIKAGIKRVVIGIKDPNPFVDGKGIEQLRSAGIEVYEGVLQEDCTKINRFFIKHIGRKIPFVTLKIAQSIDGKISKNRKQQTWLTAEKAQQYVHQLRTEYDAVLIGAGTVNSDNPQLTVRFAQGRNPYRLIIDGGLDCDENARVFTENNDYRTILFSRKQSDEYNCRIVVFPGQSDQKINFNDILKKIYQLKIGSVLVEGGSDIFSQLYESNLFDEIIFLIAPTIFGTGVTAMQNPKEGSLELIELKSLQPDVLLRYKNKV